MTDFEKVKQFHDWLGDNYEVEGLEDIPEWDRNKGCNQRLIVNEKGSWYSIYYDFKDGKLLTHYVSE